LGNWLKLGIPVIAVSILLITIISISATGIYAQQNYEIPQWFKSVAEFWSQGQVSDSEFGDGLSYLIDKEVIKVPKIQSLENEIKRLETENKILKRGLEFYEKENAELTGNQGTVISSPIPIPVPSDPTEFGFPSWEGGKPINIGGITIYINEFGYMSSGGYFGLDMTLEYTRGGNPVNLEVTNVSIIDEEGFVFDADDSEFTKFAGMYSESIRRGLVLFENSPKDFNELDIVVTVIEKHVVDDSYTFTFPYSFN